jgi:hypothetical protein
MFTPMKIEIEHVNRMAGNLSVALGDARTSVF